MIAASTNLKVSTEIAIVLILIGGSESHDTLVWVVSSTPSIGGCAHVKISSPIS